MEKSVEAILDTRLTEALRRFQQEADKLTRSNIGKWHTALHETLESMSGTLQDKLRKNRFVPPTSSGKDPSA